MSAQHTPGRLRLFQVGDNLEFLCPATEDGESILTITHEGNTAFAVVLSDMNARRLVACWNACEGITDPENVVPRLLALNELVPDLENQAATLRAKCDELLAALKEARRWIGDGECSDGLAREHWTPEYRAAVDRIDAAIAKVTGEQT